MAQSKKSITGIFQSNFIKQLQLTTGFYPIYFVDELKWYVDHTSRMYLNVSNSIFYNYIYSSVNKESI